MQAERETVLDWLLRGVDNLDSADAIAALDAYADAVRADLVQRMESR